jgi:hypothetical protein
VIRARTILGALLAMTAAAAAQPIEHTCEVRFVRAPDDVRHVIETWLAAEPRCTSKIDLRVIPTEQGFYLIAQRPDGRIHERFVPDAQSAGVLVASWVADDWVAPQSNVWSSPRPAGAPIAPVLAPPQNTRSAESSVSAISTPRSRDTNAARWLSLGTTFSVDGPENVGLRGELDVLSRGNFTLGAALAFTRSMQGIANADGYGEMVAADYAATLYGAYTLRSDRWELRTALGLGGVYSNIQGIIEPSPGTPWPSMPYIEGSGTGVMGTASMILTARMGDRWGIHAGLIVHTITETLPTNQGMDLVREDAHMFFLTGVRFRL